MDDISGRKPEKRICAGLLAHVDAGKTTLAEGLLYVGGQLKSLGRVDHKDAFLDNFSLERERGITIFSKQAQIRWEGMEIILLDTPGHMDFSAEMERTLQVLDYCILVISGTDGVQSHVRTLWRLLDQYKVPVFLFVNKMDRPGTDRARLLKELQRELDGGCQEFGRKAESRGEPFWEEVSLCHETLLEKYLEEGCLDQEALAQAVRERHLFPCYFGSALRLEGVEELLRGMHRYAPSPVYPQEFGARVYKISRDEEGVRLTHLKVTGGVLQVKMPVGNAGSASGEEQIWEEKADQLRIYAGSRYTAVTQVEAGGICAVAGLDKTFVGQGLGREARNALPLLVPVLTYGLALPEGSDAVQVLGQLRRLEEEEPLLHVMWTEKGDDSFPRIHVQVMGEVQIEVLKRLILERFGLAVEFTDGQIVYKETIAEATVGIGHFEPLRHYAEVHLLLEPGEPGSGMQFASACGEDALDRNWQRLVLTHLEEKSHLGVLTGSPLTDMKITLLAGRAHVKHTEGGDFRQATYRAVRQGLMQGESILLEPVFSFRLEVPREQVGRAMTDIQRMHGRFEAPVTEGQYTVLTGSAPVAAMRSYQKEVSAYTRGLGRLSCTLKGYEPCHNAEEVIERIGYDAEEDPDNLSCSVFCSHGAGVVVDWRRVPEYAHVDSSREAEAAGLFFDKAENRWKAGNRAPSADGGGETGEPERGSGAGGGRTAHGKAGHRPSSGEPDGGRAADYISLEEIDEIFRRTYGKSAQDYTPYRYNGLNTSCGQNADNNRDADNRQEMRLSSMKRASEGQGLRGIGEALCPGASEGGRRDLEGGLTGRRDSGKELSGGNRAAKSEEYLLVDGYNIIFAWEELRSLAERNINSARDKLMDVCSNYQGFAGCTLILVYDAYKVKGGTGSVQKYHNIYVVYTKEAETADQYIEKTVHEIGRKHRVTVATSDALEQMIIWGEGAVRLSAQGFLDTVEAAARQMREQYLDKEERIGNRPFEGHL